MDIYEYAMQMEKDGETYYRELAGKVDNKGLKKIVTMLANAEVIHYNVFLKMKMNQGIHLTDTPILSNAKNIFTKMKEENKHYFILENIINFVSRPQTWLENAEWHHLEEY